MLFREVKCNFEGSRCFSFGTVEGNVLIAMRIRKREMNYLCKPANMPTTSGRVFRHSLLSQKKKKKQKKQPSHKQKSSSWPTTNMPISQKIILKDGFPYSSHMATLDALPGVHSPYFSNSPSKHSTQIHSS